MVRADPAIKDGKLSALQQQFVRASEEWEGGEIKCLTDLNEERDRQRQEAERQQRIATARERVSYALDSLVGGP